MKRRDFIKTATIATGLIWVPQAFAGNPVENAMATWKSNNPGGCGFASNGTSLTAGFNSASALLGWQPATGGSSQIGDNRADISQMVKGLSGGLLDGGPTSNRGVVGAQGQTVANYTSVFSPNPVTLKAKYVYYESGANDVLVHNTFATEQQWYDQAYAALFAAGISMMIVTLPPCAQCIFAGDDTELLAYNVAVKTYQLSKPGTLLLDAYTLLKDPNSKGILPLYKQADGTHLTIPAYYALAVLACQIMYKDMGATFPLYGPTR